MWRCIRGCQQNRCNSHFVGGLSQVGACPACESVAYLNRNVEGNVCTLDVVADGVALALRKFATVEVVRDGVGDDNPGGADGHILGGHGKRCATGRACTDGIMVEAIAWTA